MDTHCTEEVVEVLRAWSQMRMPGCFQELNWAFTLCILKFRNVVFRNPTASGMRSMRSNGKYLKILKVQKTRRSLPLFWNLSENPCSNQASLESSPCQAILENSVLKKTSKNTYLWSPKNHLRCLSVYSRILTFSHVFSFAQLLRLIFPNRFVSSQSCENSEEVRRELDWFESREFLTTIDVNHESVGPTPHEALLVAIFGFTPEACSQRVASSSSNKQKARENMICVARMLVLVLRRLLIHIWFFWGQFPTSYCGVLKHFLCLTPLLLLLLDTQKET